MIHIDNFEVSQSIIDGIDRVEDFSCERVPTTSLVGDSRTFMS